LGDLDVLARTVEWLADPDHASDTAEGDQAMRDGIWWTAEEIRAEIARA